MTDIQTKFGPSGNSKSFLEEGNTKSVEAPAWLAAKGLAAYEYQCTRGVKTGEDTARSIGLAAKQNGILLSVHAPYYINLSSKLTDRVEKNIAYVTDTARLAEWMGAERIVVHCGGIGKLTREKAIRNTYANLKLILSALDESHLTHCAVCLETMGKENVIGSAEEVCGFVASDDRLLPCIDFGHLNSRTLGGMSTQEDVRGLFELMENTIGANRTRTFHAHFSHIEYGAKGELRHLTFEDKEYGPEFLPVAREVVKRGYTPVFICESAGTQAEDALEMQRIYLEILSNTQKG